mgnify:CR=1 FL=1
MLTEQASVQVLLPPQALAHVSLGTAFLVVTLVAVPSYMCPVAVTPLAAVLIARGLPAGAVLAGLLLGPALHLTMANHLVRSHGRKAALLFAGIVLTLAWGAGGFVEWSELPIALRVEIEPHLHHPLEQLALGICAAVVARMLYLFGIHGFFATASPDRSRIAV